MIKLCQKKKIDLILTKSISRFGRNTLDMLRTLRTLNHCGTEVYFEQENIRLSRQHIQVLLTAYCALAQAESEDMSRNIKWGIKRGFQNGTSGYAEFVCYGYKRGDGGRLAIDEPDAVIVRRIFRMRAEGHSLGEISNWLYKTRFQPRQAKPAGVGRRSANCCEMKNTLETFCFRRLLFGICFQANKLKTMVSWKGS